MKKSSYVYPSLLRYFKTVSKFGDSCNIKRTRATECLQGKKQFTEVEKNCIANALIAMMVIDGDYSELQKMIEAREDFDKIFRIGGTN